MTVGCLLLMTPHHLVRVQVNFHTVSTVNRSDPSYVSGLPQAHVVRNVQTSRYQGARLVRTWRHKCSILAYKLCTAYFRRSYSNVRHAASDHAFGSTIALVTAQGDTVLPPRSNTDAIFRRGMGHFCVIERLVRHPVAISSRQAGSAHRPRPWKLECSL